MGIDIFSYDCIYRLLNDILEAKKKRNPLFSLRAWAKQLGYKSPSGLSLMLKGDRPVSSTLLLAVIRTECFSGPEAEHLRILYYKSSAIGDDADIFLQLLKNQA